MLLRNGVLKDSHFEADSETERVKGMRALWKNMRKEKIVFAFLVLIHFFLNMFGIAQSSEVQVVLLATSGALFLVLSVYVCFLQRKNMLIFAMSLMVLYFNYSLVAGVCWSTDALPRIFSGQTFGELLRAVNIVLVFFMVFICFLKDNTEIDITVYLKKQRCSWIIVGVGTAYISLAPFLFYRTESFGSRGVITPFYEYSLVVMIVALAFCGRNWVAISALIASSGWIIVHGLLHGERALALQMLIAWGVYLLLHRFSLKWIIPAGFVGIVVFTLFGLTRGMNNVDENTLQKVYRFLLNGGLANDTSFAAFQTSVDVVRLADASTIGERLLLFCRYLLYIVGGSAVQGVHLEELSREVGTHGGGGWLPFYFHFWFGYAGVVVIGCIVGWMINKLSHLQSEKHYLTYLSLYIVSTVPRWYLYSPAPLTRSMIIFSIIFGAAWLFYQYAGQVWRACVNRLIPKK